jgi:xanthine dehydrogenase YagS FAD-binding subunit
MRGMTRRGLLGSTAAGVATIPLVPVRARADAETPSAPAPVRTAEMRDVVLQVNGKRVPLSVEPRTSLLDALREQAGLTGTKKGCDHGSCGACTVHMNGDRILSCLALASRCIATHPSDMPVALIALDASVELRAPDGRARTLPIAQLYRLPGDTPHIETNLQPGELITAIVVPSSDAARRSVYVKVRDRESFEFALVSAAVGLDIKEGVIRDARVAMGGVGTMPWRAPQVEAALLGQPARTEVLEQAARRAADGAQPATQNGFKLRLMQRTVLRALQSAA